MRSTMVLPSHSNSFVEQLNALHEMLYTRGGIRPVNAAIEELAKIVLLQLKHAHDPDWSPAGFGPLREILSPEWIRAGGDVSAVKRAFSEIIALPEFAASVPGDSELQPIWPLDEPFRLQQADVLSAALEILDVDLLREIETREDYDILGTAFDVLLRGRYDHSGGLATYLTPHSVATMLAELCLSDLDVSVEWTSGNPHFGDPCCGTGRFLIAGLLEARRLAVERYGDSPDAVRYADAFGGSGLIGADQSSGSVAKARLNLLLFGNKHPRVFLVQDSITDGHLDCARGRMRLILTNPPFGEGKYDAPEGIARTRHLLPSIKGRTNIDPALAFVTRCLDLLGDGGRLGIVLPDGLVDGSTLRQALLATDSSTRLRGVSIEANVSLPTATFALSGTVAKTSCLVLQKAGKASNFVFLAKAEHVGYLKQNGGAIVDPEGDDLPTIAKIGADIWAGRTLVPALVDGIVTVSTEPAVTLVRRDGLTTVDPSRVDPDALAARAELLEVGGSRLFDYLKPMGKKARNADDALPFISVLHVDKLGCVDWHDAGTYRPSTPGRSAHAGNLLISLLNPRKLRATVIPDDVDEVICSSEFGVFETTVNPYMILVLLNDRRVRAQINPLGRGTSSSRRRIDFTDIASIVVPPIDRETERRAGVVQKAHVSLRSAGLNVASALEL